MLPFALRIREAPFPARATRGIRGAGRGSEPPRPNDEGADVRRGLLFLRPSGRRTEEEEEEREEKMRAEEEEESGVGDGPREDRS